MLSPHNEKAYKARVMSGVLEALVKASITEVEGVKTAAILSGEVTDVLISVIAGLVAESEACDSGPKVKRLVDDITGRLRGRIVSARQMGTGLKHMQLGEVQ